MTNHVHLLMTPLSKGAMAKTMQAVCSRYVRYFNRRYERTGTLFEGRYHASLVDNDRYVLACHRYIELNPCRAGIVADPAEYLSSSYRFNALGEADPLLTEHPTYLALADSPKARQGIYRRFIRSSPDERETYAIRKAARSNAALGLVSEHLL